MVYMTQLDADTLRRWINSDPDVAWIVLKSRSGNQYSWHALEAIEQLVPQEYALWHKTSCRLTIPSGSPQIPDVDVSDPFNGWTQVLSNEATRPWFGANLPGPFSLRFEGLREADKVLGRSDFSW